MVQYGGTGRDIARLKEQFVVRYGGTGRDIARLKEQFVVRYGGTGRDIARLKEQFVVRYGGTGRDIARLKEQFVVRYGGTGRDIARLKEQFVVRYGGTGRDIARLKEQFVVRYSGTGRDIARLKEQWKRMKTTAKKELSDFERSQKKTVAGKVPISPSGLSEQIKALLKHEFETLSNPFDDDFIETNIAAKYMTTIIIEDYNLGNDTDETYVYDLDDESAGPSTENTPELSGERDTVVHLQRTRHDPMTIYYSKLRLRNTCRKLRFSLKIFRSQPILTEKMARSKRVNTFHANSDIIILCHDRLARLRSQHAEQTRQEAAGPGKVSRGDAFYIMPFMTAKSVPELSALFY